MFDFLHKPYPFNTDLKYGLKQSFGMAIGVFIFILFFEPLEIGKQDVETYILIIAGFAGITLLILGTMKIIVPLLFRNVMGLERWDLIRELVFQFLIWAFNSVAFSFYLAYVGKVHLTMYLAFKIVLICLSVPVLTTLIYEIHLLRLRASEMEGRIDSLNERLQEASPASPARIELYSENRSENLSVDSERLLFIKSAENYVECLYREEDRIQKKLLRTTLRAVEEQLSAIPGMIRCHRTCLVNMSQVDKLMRTGQGYRLRIRDMEEDIPVSRQYLLAVRSALL